MMERLPNLIIFFNLLLMASTLANARVKSLFLFGDSLFDPGNNHFVKNCTIQADFPPYGSAFFNKPTGRFTNGRTVGDFTAQYLGVEFVQPYQKLIKELAKDLINGTQKVFPANGIGFASAGSGVLPDTNKKEGVSSLQVQLRQLQAVLEKKYIPEDQITNSIVFLESGSNDIFDYHVSVVPRLFPEAHVDKILKELGKDLDKLCKLGARRIAIFGVGPMGCVPATVLLPKLPVSPTMSTCHDGINSMIKRYNTGLENFVSSLPKKYPAVTCVFGAVYNVVQSFRANPSVHGFTNMNDACCGAGPRNGQVQCGLEGYSTCPKPNEFFYWDYFHPTEHTYELLSRAFWEGDSTKIRPMNIKALADLD